MARPTALRIDECDRRTGRQVVGEWHHRVGEHGQERLHPLDRDPLAHLLEHASQTGEALAQRRRALADRGRQQQLAAGQESDVCHLSGQRALVGDRERADLIDLVAEELDPIRVVGAGGKTSRMPPRTANSPRRETMSTRW
jgi:hypothetical protein